MAQHRKCKEVRRDLSRDGHPHVAAHRAVVRGGKPKGRSNEEEPEGPEEGPLTEEGKGLAYLYLKTVLDAMVAAEGR